MENQFNSPTSSLASLKDKWSAEYVDNSPECNPVSYDFLPQRGSPKGDETPVAKKKRTSLKTRFGTSPITGNVQNRLLPPPPSEKLEDLKKFTNRYKEILTGNGEDEDDQSDSEDMVLLSNMMKTADRLENIFSQSHSIEAQGNLNNNLPVNNLASASNEREISSLVKLNESQNSLKKTGTPVGRVSSGESQNSCKKMQAPAGRGSSSESQTSWKKTPTPGGRGSSCSERKSLNSSINNNNRLPASKNKDNNKLVRTGADRNSHREASNPKPDEKLDLLPNEISLLNDGNDDGFTSIDDTTLSYLCSASQATFTSSQVCSTQDNKCKIDYNKMPAPSSIPARCTSKVSATNSNSSVNLSVPNKCLTKVPVPNKCTAQEIERKRREAMKRLLERKKINSQIQSQKVS
ncbi:uncharacterized protein LOC111046125 isoform X2 [Nilaparvata lugens]|uniref:uncharacterized protein LOC111046125 isoform X2 n=1 Tax=Nilaparvata lugens TaxID=108931 RepID=UPI00193DE6E0|nr:uncharacterized protein LOC111046125 isoform X2 [Nilaparvata lugens]